ncbi:diadenylate cyclase CdaA [Falsiporphyromonas endometrii]|uniref:Diadenylate cyclase n=1 Tax=Falsiporphyromonas endometrii TaxID=1387297 RepID=A0ABV9K6E6_9PORP|nr:diadenylate cyclase CdaA [Porphyromonadaceae bacterium]
MWLTFTFKDFVDILLVALFLYYTYSILRSSGTKALFSGIIFFVVLWIIISQVLQMKLMGAILDKFINVGFLLIVIIFQDEIRKFLATLGSTKWRIFNQIFQRDKGKEAEERKWVAPVVLACMNMAKKKTGALIAIQQTMDLTPYEYTGERFRSEISARLIENIFFKNSPLHDGAMIIADNEIKAAGCILPVAANTDLNKDLGLRHRSALGLSQETDAKVIIVSEERGAISVAYRGEIFVDITVDKLQEILNTSPSHMVGA